MKKIICFLLSFTLIFFSGCVEKNKEVTSDEGIRDYLIYNIETMPKDLIMLEDGSQREEDLLLSLFDGLVGLDKSNNIVPELAEKWQVSKDGIDYKFYIKDNLFWSNGNGIVARDFEKFFKDILIYCKENNIRFNELNSIYGVKDYLTNGNIDNIAIKAKEDNILEIRLNNKDPYFLSTLSKPKYKLRKIDKKNKNYKKSFNEIPYTGAFCINKIEKDQITIKKNSRYWDKQNIKINRIVLKSIQNSEEALAHLKTSKLDLFMNPPIAEINNLNKEGLISKKLSLETGNIIFNKKDYIDLNLRRAIDSCISREDMCSKLLYGKSAPAIAYVPNNIAENDDISYGKNYFSLNKNLQRAKEFLDKSEYKKEKKDLKIISIEDPISNKIANSIIGELKESLDINLNLVNCKDENELEQKIKNGDYDLAFVKNKAKNNDPLFFLLNFTSDSLQYQDFLNKIKLEDNMWKKREYINKAQDVLAKDLYTIPVCFFYDMLCKRSRVQGQYITIDGNVIIKKITLAPYN
ncbi:peptide ABC transporter substrate-binding protein [Clostridium botulinum]|uniref:Peptide ABC transporter substrate-binding protein n=1 Tax=Clostridium botulinum TaxID=1491 RepID=A0A846J6N8_CLOBO|nr:peptide ABC transporter substrate-binding protein [Clostridium botulinum]ACA54215.1 bacterial extracellular solute-binding protein, family 5 [Clostridium botulinum A3 str. Loch Maree]NFH65291.1 peptide ABC transporter substrate-binding protein [Clostridium botulinum]NFJ09072.1 peptide ABC transporter substrate-binding protein [Clostridium botulinum]NFK16340.1 peptide ABC transporter substrate-binding protein [Clostridium botulinum]NFM92359.1 peptide ABC transporter substrate-binding protein